MRKLIESASVALGLTTIYLLWLTGPLFTSRHGTVYHWSSSASQLFLPAIADFCIVWMVLTLLFLFTLRPGKPRIALWSGVIFFIPWIILKNWEYLSGKAPSHSLNVALFPVALAASLLLVKFWRPAFEAKFETVVAFASTLLVFASISGLAILCELAWFGWQARSLNAQLPLHHSVAGQAKSAGRPRIIWIVFDELSYEQVYEDRFQGLQLPAFDQLASQATIFTHPIPVGIRTETGLAVLDDRRARGRHSFLSRWATSLDAQSRYENVAEI
jgi:hypothetical protein